MRLRPFATPTGRAAPRSAVRGRARNVAALAERGRRAAPRLVGSDQAEPTRSATASTLMRESFVLSMFQICYPRDHGRFASPQNHSRRHGRVLRVGRTARRPNAQRPAGGRRLRRQARRRRRGELRGAALRRAIRHAVGHSDAQVPGNRVRPAPVRSLPRRLAADSGDFRRLHAAGRTPFSRRSLSRCHRQLERHPDGFGDRQGDQGANSRRNRAYGVSRNLLQQIPRQARL